MPEKSHYTEKQVIKNCYCLETFDKGYDVWPNHVARWFLNIWSLILEGKNTCALISFNANVLGIIFFGLKCPAFSDTFIQTLSIKIYQVFVVTCLIFTDLIKIDKREMLPCSISLLWFLDQRGYISEF